MKVNSKMISIMDMVDIFIQMATFIQVIGKMERDKDGGNQQISQEKYMKECGSTVSLWVAERSLHFQIQNLRF